MWKYIAKKTIMFILTIVIMSFLVFACIRIMPGDPVNLIYGDKEVSQEMVERVRKMYHLDKPIIEQYIIYMKDFVKGDFGYSYFSAGKSVASIIGKCFTVTCQLTVFVFPIAALSGIFLGIISAAYAGKVPDKLLNGMMAIVTAIPSVPLAVFLVYIFSIKLKLLPIAGWGSIEQMILPAIFISMWPALNLSKMVRALMIEEIQKPYVFLCKTRGMGKFRILLRECLPNIMVPVSTRLGMMFGGMLEGTLIAELVFNIPGMGRKSLEAIARRDYPVIMVVVLLSTIIYTFINYVMDIMQVCLDPKIKESEKIE